MSLSAKLIEIVRAAARARRQWEADNIYYTKSEAAARFIGLAREEHDRTRRLELFRAIRGDA